MTLHLRIKENRWWDHILTSERWRHDVGGRGNADYAGCLSKKSLFRMYFFVYFFSVKIKRKKILTKVVERKISSKIIYELFGVTWKLMLQWTEEGGFVGCLSQESLFRIYFFVYFFSVKIKRNKFPTKVVEREISNKIMY